MKPQAARTLDQLNRVAALKGADKTDAEIGVELRLTRGRVSQLNRVLKLPRSVLQPIYEGRLSVAHGVALLGLPPSESARLAVIAVEKKWSAGQLREAARKRAGGVDLRELVESADPNVRALETELGERVGTQVSLQSVRGERGGWLMLRYFDFDQLEGLLERIR